MISRRRSPIRSGVRHTRIRRAQPQAGKDNLGNITDGWKGVHESARTDLALAREHNRPPLRGLRAATETDVGFSPLRELPSQLVGIELQARLNDQATTERQGVAERQGAFYIRGRNGEVLTEHQIACVRAVTDEINLHGISSYSI